MDEKDRILNEGDVLPLVQDSSVSDRMTRPPVTYWQDSWRRLKGNRLSVVVLTMLSLVALVILVGPFLSPWTLEQSDFGAINSPPSAEHWFGTDRLGRDLFVRVCLGGRVSLVIGIVGAFLDISIGMVYGSVAGYAGGKLDEVMMRVLEFLMSLPYLVVVILVSLIVGRGTWALIIAMTITGWCSTARLIRGQVLQIREQEYVLAARCLGTRPWRIVFKHIVPNVMGVLIVAITMDIPSFIFGEAFLSYIGLGVQSPMTSWGSLASSAQENLTFYPWQMFFPALFISVTMLSFQLLGDGLRDALDPQLRE